VSCTLDMSTSRQQRDDSTTVDVRFECTGCAACCTQENMLVTLTGTDIVRIAKLLDLDAKELLRAIDFYVLSENESVPRGLRKIPSVETEEGRAYVALKKLEDTGCIFLKENKCMIYPYRPGVCKSFPFVFGRKNGELAWGLNAMKHICPGLGKGDYVKASKLQQIGQRVTEEMEIFKEFVKEWNRKEENPTAFSFLKAVLSDPRFSV
jgi:Fe-S-cluster containining protein